MVLDTNAGVDPGAVVVETLDTAIADGTVFRARGSQDAAVGAELAGVHLVEEVLEGDFGADVAWVDCRGENEGDY